jgi:hypothetical protein
LFFLLLRSPTLQIINEFVYPFGMDVERINMKKSSRKIKEILFLGSKKQLQDKFFFFTMKNEDYFNRSER